MPNFSKISVAILAGGLGTRLLPKVAGKPKILAQVGGHPFLEYLLHQLNQANFKNVVLCTGYLSNQVEKTFGESYKDLHLSYSSEQVPLGTAGCLRRAFPLLKSETILVMNGDSFCEVDFRRFWQFHLSKNSDASLVISAVTDTSHSGKVKLGSDDSIIGFQEKEVSGAGFVNAGIYLINKALIAKIPEGKEVSIERDIFPNWIGKRFYGYKGNHFVDIGTPESYTWAGKFFSPFKLGAKRRFVLLDRDGTIIVKKNYLSNPNHVELLPGVSTALKELQNLGLGLLIITNQSGIGRKYFDLATLEKIHQKLTYLLLKSGVVLDGIYFCPHIPEDNCLCRKPKKGLVEKARKEHDFNPKVCFVVGDNIGDIELGKNIGATTIFVRTGYGKQVEKEVNSDYVVNNLEAILPIIKHRV